MKKETVLFFLLSICFNQVFSQDLPNLKLIKLNKKAHYKDVEPIVEKTLSYLFNTPIDRNNKTRAQAGEFLVKWMNGTPDYTFYLAEKETNYFNTNSDLMLMYMASLTKFTLANKALKDQKCLVLGAMSFVLPYLNQQEEKKTWGTNLWQLNEAYQKGKLEKFLYPN